MFTAALAPSSWKNLIFAGVLLGVVVAGTAIPLLHHDLFVAWHRWQNIWVPSEGCLTYEPNITRLYATYRMTRPEFDAWISSHPWTPAPGDPQVRVYEKEVFGIDQSDACYETVPAPNGRQFRAYFQGDTMYLAYYVM